MRDRTRELRQDSGGSSGEGEEEDEGEEPARDHVTLMRLRPPAPPEDDTLQQARGVRVALRGLQLKLEALEQLQERDLGTPLPGDDLKRELQVLREEIQEQTQEIRTRLKALEPRKEEEEDENRNSIGARVKRTQHGALSQQLLQLSGRCHQAQARYRHRSLQRLRRQLHIAGSPPVSEEELEQMLETGQSEVFISNVLGASRATRAGLEELGQRHRELQRLERSLRELGGTLALLGTSVQAQGEVLDRIELQVQDSGRRLLKGRQQLGAAQRRRRGRRQCVAVSLCLGAVVVVVIGLVTGVTMATG